jgi:hypothetical protein
MAMPSEGRLRSNRRLPKNCSGGYSNDEKDCEEEDQVRSPYMSGAGDRVSGLDMSNANCMATTENPDTAIGLTTIQFYYAIESSSPVENSLILELESILFVLISTNILWCTQPKEPAVNIGGGRRMLSDIFEDPRCKSHGARYKIKNVISTRSLSNLACYFSLMNSSGVF